LKIAIETELNEKFAVLNIPFIVGEVNKNEYKKVEITDETGSLFIEVDSISDKKVISDSFEKNARYTIVSHSYNPDPDQIDSLWNAWFVDNNIESMTKVCVSVSLSGAIKQMCTDVSSLTDSNYFTTYYAGLNNEIEINTYLSIGFFSPFKYGTRSGALLLILFLIVICVSILLISLNKHRVGKTNLPADSQRYEVDEFIDKTVNTSHLMTDIYQLGDNLYFNPHISILKSDSREIKLRPQLSELLLLLLTAPDYFMKKKGIAEKLWESDNEIGIENRLQRLISDLRKSLQHVDPDIRIEYEAKGYRLYLKETSVIN